MEFITSWLADSWYTRYYPYLYFTIIIAGIIWLWKMDGSIPKPKKKDKK